MSIGERDKLMSDIATKAADEYYRKSENATDLQIKSFPETYLQQTIPYLTVRTLHRLEETLKRHETALKSLERDSRRIKWFAIVTAFFDRRPSVPYHRFSEISSGRHNTFTI